MTVPRVAFFTDCFHEVNGVARTSREFLAFARRRELPFLCVAPAAASRLEDSPDVVGLEPSPLTISLDTDLRFDLAFLRHRARLRRELERFRPDIVHVTSPGQSGILGAILAHQLGVPLAASWHTNVQEFAARRLERWLGAGAAAITESAILRLLLRFYRIARVIFAPNAELVELLARRTGRPVRLMPRGIDTSLFHPRPRAGAASDFVIGYVGRLTPEKNVRLLARLENGLLKAGVTDYRFLVVGHGGEGNWLRANLRRVELPGVLRGEALARAYASMDVFVFPSETDTFGNVVLEALASGVPTLVTARGGPKSLVRTGENGFVACGAEEFVQALVLLHRNRRLLETMRVQARASVAGRSWDAVFEGVNRGYADCFAAPAPQSKGVTAASTFRTLSSTVSTPVWQRTSGASGGS